MNKLIITLLFVSQCVLSFAQNAVRKVNIDFNQFKNTIQSAPLEGVIGIANAQSSTNIISLPMANGEFVEFAVVEYSILPEGVNADIKTYYGQRTDDSSVSCRISITKEGMTATIFTQDGIIVIEPSNQAINSNEYDVYLQTEKEFKCETEGNLNYKEDLNKSSGILNYSNGTSLRTYRMALIITNEFYTSRGNNDADVNAAIAGTINNLNGLFEKEIAVRFTLVSPNNPTSANVFYRKTQATNTYNQDVDLLRVEMDTLYSAANYDIGHTLHSTGGGVAYAGVCNDNFKGGAWSGVTSATSILLLAHEVGHQFSAPHTFSGNGSASCDNNISAVTAVEPGSGNTIMSYSGLCSNTQNIAGGEVPYFHTQSLETMINYVVTGTGNTCGVTTNTGNTPPVANAGTAFTIPRNTPFSLIGSATDANNDDLTYTWEQYNFGVANDRGALGNTTNGVGGYPATTSTTAPLFRTRQSTSSTRYFPALNYILNNANDPTDVEGEDLPSVSRTMLFRLTARDNRAGGGGTNVSAVTITVDATKGPLQVTSPNTAVTWASSSNQTITWDVNNTNTLSANVDIYLSVDGGSTYPYLIVGNTPNDGSATYTVSANIPNSSQARLKVVSKGSSTANFFDVSNANFTVTSTCMAINSLICPTNSVSNQSGNGVFNLGLQNVASQKLLGNSKAYATEGAASYPVINYTNDTFDACQASGWGNSPAVLVPFRVSQTGSYNISGNGNGFVAWSIFGSTTYSCANFVSSNSWGAIGATSSRNVTLNECTTYYALLYNITSGNTSITFSVQGSGEVYEIQNIPAGYSYTFIAKNVATNVVTGESSSSNFTSLPGGTYEVSGLMYQNGVVPSSFVGQTVNSIIGANCLVLSDNKKILNITANPCPSLLTLTNPTDNIGSGTITRQASATNGSISATNFVTGSGTRATYQAKNIQLNAGFRAESGTVFTAEAGGCN